MLIYDLIRKRPSVQEHLCYLLGDQEHGRVAQNSAEYTLNMNDAIEQYMTTEKRSNWLEEQGDPIEKSFTWCIEEQVIEQLFRVDKLMRERGLHAEIGLEIEFSQKDYPDTDTTWIKERNARIDSLSGLHTPDDIRLENEIKFLETANASEFAFYKLYQTELKPLLNTRFLERYDSAVLHDDTGVMEIQTIPMSLQELVESRGKIIKTLKNEFNKFHIKDTDGTGPSYHINLSIHDENGNLFDSNHPDFYTTGKAIAEGTAYSLSRSLMFTYSERVFKSKNTATATLGPSRHNGFRFADGRIEIKFSGDPSDEKKQHVDLVTLLALSGALYGFDSKDTQSDIRKAEVVYAPSIKSSDQNLRIFCHALQDCYIDSVGYLKFNERYILTKLDTLLRELGVTQNEPDEGIFANFTRGLVVPEELGILMQFLKHIRVEKNESGTHELQYPESEEGVYDFVYPEINMHRVPEEIRSAMENGTEYTIDSLRKFVLPGEMIPRLQKTKKIDIAHLKETLRIASLVPKFRIYEPAYEFENLKSGIDTINHRVSQFESNASLKYLDIEFVRSLEGVTTVYINDMLKKIDSVNHPPLSPQRVFDSFKKHIRTLIRQ
jgi:hypothetical protein